MAYCNISENPIFSWFKPKMPNLSYWWTNCWASWSCLAYDWNQHNQRHPQKASCGCVLRQLPLSATQVMVLIELVPIYGHWHTSFSCLNFKFNIVAKLVLLLTVVKACYEFFFFFAMTTRPASELTNISTSFIMPKGSMVNELALVYSVQIMPYKIKSHNDWHMLVFVQGMWQCVLSCITIAWLTGKAARFLHKVQQTIFILCWFVLICIVETLCRHFYHMLCLAKAP